MCVCVCETLRERDGEKEVDEIVRCINRGRIRNVRSSEEGASDI